MMDISEPQDQTFTSRSNIYVCDNHGRDLDLLGVNALVFLIIHFVPSNFELIWNCQLYWICCDLHNYQWGLVRPQLSDLETNVQSEHFFNRIHHFFVDILVSKTTILLTTMKYCTRTV